MIRTLTLLSALILFSFSCGATHILSVDIGSKHLGQQEYLVRVAITARCYPYGTTGPPTTIPVSYYCPSSNTNQVITLPVSAFDELYFDCVDSNAYCYSQLYNPNMFAVSIRIYSDTIDFSNYSGCSDGKLTFFTGLRPSGTNYLQQPNMLAECAFNPVAENSSPSTLGLELPYLIFDNVYHSSFLGNFDPDGDSLVYYLDTAITNYNLISGYSFVSYNSSTGASALEPIPGISFDSSTAELNVTGSIPTGYNAGLNAIAWKIEEWDPIADTLKSYVHRESTIHVFPDTFNSSPVVDSVWTNSVSFMTAENVSLSYCFQDTFEIWVSASDTNSFDSLWAELLYDPGEFYLDVEPTSPGSSTFLITGTLIGQQTFGGVFYVRVKDNHCPFNGYTVFPISIESECENFDTISICQNFWELVDIGGDSAIWSVISGDSIGPNSFDCVGNGCTQAYLKLTQNTVYNIWHLESGTWSQDTLWVKVLPQLNVGANQSICLGDTVFINLYPGDTFNWALYQGDSIVSGTNFGCLTCANTWISPADTSTYVVQSIICPMDAAMKTQSPFM